MGIWKDKSRNHWVYKFQSGGKSYGGRGFKTKREAEIARAARRKELEQQPAQLEDGTTFKEVSYEYLDAAERKFVKKTYDFKKMVIKNFHATLAEDTLIEDIVPSHVEAYLKTRPSNNNWNAHRKDLMALFQFALRRHYIDRNPVADVDKMPHTPARKTMPTEKQVLQLIAVCDPEIERPLFLSILHTLGRVDEILRLTWEDVNFQKRTVTLWTRKRKGGAYEADTLPMNEDLYNVLHSLFKKRTQTKWVFLNPKTENRYNRRPKFMKGLCKRAFDPNCKKIEDYKGPLFGFHHLRHFMASFLSDQEKYSTKTLQRYLRHKEARTTEIYLHSIGDGLREAAQSIEGKFTSVVKDEMSKKVVAGSGGGFDEKSRHTSENAANGVE